MVSSLFEIRLLAVVLPPLLVLKGECHFIQQLLWLKEEVERVSEVANKHLYLWKGSLQVLL